MSRGGIEDQQPSLHPSFRLTVEDAAHLAELRHEVFLGVQSSGGVDQKMIDAARLGCLNRIEQDRPGIGSTAALDDVDA